MPVIEVPRRYRVPTGGQATIAVDGDTVRVCLEHAETKHPGFGELVLDDAGELRLFVKLFVNGDLLERDALEIVANLHGELVQFIRDFVTAERRQTGQS